MEPSAGQVEWVKKNTVRFRSIDPEDEDFSDLQPLKSIIGNARIVQLGEQSHGDGSCFETKIRLIKFLHQQMGFDILAFESGLYDCGRAWQAFQNEGEPLESAQLGVFGIWTGSRQTLPLWNYLSKQATTQNPLELMGFDCQLTGRASREFLPQELKDYAKQIDALANSDERLNRLIEEMIQLSQFKESKHGPGEFDSSIRQLIESIDQLANQDLKDKFWRQFLESVRVLAAYRWSEDQKTAATISARDQQMAENLSWIARSYPNRKIIVWAASFHIMRNAAEIEVPSKVVDYKEIKPMGHWVEQEFGDDLMTIGFTALEGQAGAWMRGSRDIGAAPSGTLEDVIGRAEIENGLVPLNVENVEAAWLKNKIFARPLGYTWMKANWGRHFDAMIFNRKMEASRR